MHLRAVEKLKVIIQQSYDLMSRRLLHSHRRAHQEKYNPGHQEIPVNTKNLPVTPAYASNSADASLSLSNLLKSILEAQVPAYTVAASLMRYPISSPPLN